MEQCLKSFKQQWIAYIQDTIKSTTLSTYINIFNTIAEDIGTISLSHLDKTFLNNYVSKKCKLLSEKYVCNFVTVLNSIFNFLYKNNFIQKEISLKALNFLRNDVIPLDEEEQKKLCTYLKENLSDKKLCYKNIILLIALFTGIRIGELCALKVKHINFESGYISVTKTIQRIKNLDENSNKKTIVVEVTPKSRKSIRKIPVKTELLELIKPYLLFMDSEFYILTNSNKFTEPRTLENHFDKVLKKCNIKHYKFHVLRHTFANNCLKCGMDIKVLSLVLGHSSIVITCDIYLNPSQSFIRSQLEKIPFL